MSVQRYDIPRHNSTTTFNGVVFTLPTNAEYELTGASARIDFEKKGSRSTSLRLNSANGTLIITPPYQISIPEMRINLVNGTYEWDLRITFSDGRQKIFIGGEWVIDDVITD